MSLEHFTWIDSNRYKHYNQLIEIYQAAVIDYNEWKTKFTPETRASKFSDRYEDVVEKNKLANLGWWGCPLIDSFELLDIYSQDWPNTIELITQLPGAINAAINFIQPGHTVIEHTDDYFDVDNTQTIGTIIGISMPSDDIDICGFQVADERTSWATGDIVSFNGYKKHSGWNYSNNWRVTMVLDIRRDFWNLD
jgi:aspartyl/asparaginyl beta-hydroxylase (cupin superfamily)